VAHAKSAAALETRVAQLQGQLARQKKMLDAAGEADAVQAGDAALWEKCKRQMQEECGDDSYEAVLLEELAEMRGRFQLQIDKLNDEKLEATIGAAGLARAEAERWAAERAATDQRCLVLEQRCSKYELDLERWRDSSAQ
jgi:hypothetical protein